jgi:hypothetical protein
MNSAEIFTACRTFVTKKIVTDERTNLTKFLLGLYPNDVRFCHLVLHILVEFSCLMVNLYFQKLKTDSCAVGTSNRCADGVMVGAMSSIINSAFQRCH